MLSCMCLASTMSILQLQKTKVEDARGCGFFFRGRDVGKRKAHLQVSMLMLIAKELSTTKTASSRKLAETLSRAGLLKTPCALRKPDYLGKRNMPDDEGDKSAVCVSNTRAGIAT